MAATSVTGVGYCAHNGSEHQTLGVDKLIGPRWTERHEESFGKMMRHYVDCESMVWPMAERVLYNSRLLMGLILSQAITLVGLIGLAVYTFWR